MYIILNGVRYDGVIRKKTVNEVLFYTTQETELPEALGTIETYRDDSFILAEDNVSDYLRQERGGNFLKLTNKTEPEPETESAVYSEIAAAMSEGVNEV